MRKSLVFAGLIAVLAAGTSLSPAFAARTDRASLRSIGVTSNRLLLWGIALELVLAALMIYAPPFQALLGTAALPLRTVAIVVPFPFIVWGADEIRRWLIGRSRMHGTCGRSCKAGADRRRSGPCSLG